MLDQKMYLGDGVYARFDGYQIWLTTNNGYRDTNEIALESNVLQALDLFRQRLKKMNDDEQRGESVCIHNNNDPLTCEHCKNGIPF